MKTLAGSLTLAALLSVHAPARGITPDEILVVANRQAPLSERIAEHYRQARAIPRQHVVAIDTEPEEEIDRETFRLEIERPIGAYLLSHRLVDRVLVIVLTKGVPLKIRGSGGPAGTQSSVDSELTLLYRRLVRGPVPPAGRVANPYFRPGTPAPFTRADYDIYLVTRLDGYGWDDIRALVDRARTPVRHGKVVFDLKPAFPGSGSWTGNRWLREAAERLKGGGLEVVLQASPVAGMTDVIGYAGWGSNDRRHGRSLGFHWLPGSIASWFVSSSARTFVRPPPDWVTGAFDDPRTFYAGSPQSLVGDLIAEGVSGVVGFVYEPYLDGTARPDILFPAYRAGFTLAESFYMALPHLSWEAVVVGDPLVAPFGPPALSGPAPPPGMSVFFRRRTQALEDAVKRTPSPEARHALALVYVERAKEAAREHHLDEALALARLAVDVKPDEPAALWALGAVRAARNERAEAEEAFRDLIRLAPTSPFARDAERWLGR